LNNPRPNRLTSRKEKRMKAKPKVEIEKPEPSKGPAMRTKVLFGVKKAGRYFKIVP
jgi:hypothetical protein